MRLIFTICQHVLGIIFIITVHQNSTKAFIAICVVAQVVSRCLLPRRAWFIPRRFLVVETVVLGQYNPSTYAFHCQYQSTGPSMSFTYYWPYI